MYLRHLLVPDHVMAHFDRMYEKKAPEFANRLLSDEGKKAVGEILSRHRLTSTETEAFWARVDKLKGGIPPWGSLAFQG